MTGATKTQPLAKGQIALPAFDEADYADIGGSMPETERLPVADPDEVRAYAPDYDDEVTALVPMAAIPPTHHLVVGMGTLAAMSEAEFNEKLAIMHKGQERIRIIQEQLLTSGEDYGRVKGIDRPFLHQPGAEKLANFYGFAVEQIAERIIGHKEVSEIDNIKAETGAWLSPPLAYHVRSLVHLGDFSGPVVAQGYGESSVWEEKYRYRWAKAVCPKCGREGLVKGKVDGKLKGKWWCPQREGGCNSTFEAASPEITPPAKIENTDPWSLAETLIQMAAKRSLVAAIRRATGTSGLFTQDEDSPSVRQQSERSDEPEGDATATVSTAAPRGPIAPGAKTEEVTPQQLARLVGLSKEKDVGPAALASLLLRLFNLTVDDSSLAVSHAIKQLSAAQLGRLLFVIETGSVDEPNDVILEADGMPA